MHTTDPVPAPASYDERFDALAGLSYRVAYRMVGSREDARDIAQEAMARAYARWPKVRDRAGGWVGRVTTNLALDLLRRRSRTAPAPVELTTDTAAAAALRTDLVAALRRLPRRQRDVVVLRYLADLPEADVAAALGCSTGTVKQHAHRGLAALRASLDLTSTDAEPEPGADAPVPVGLAPADPDEKGAA
jgi:RNA polymerase sigma-70 factor (sigma-E family)